MRQYNYFGHALNFDFDQGPNVWLKQGIAKKKTRKKGKEMKKMNCRQIQVTD